MVGENLEKYIPLAETIFLVLLTILEENYGYSVSQKVEEITNGRIVLGPGTLYGAINNLNKKGWIKLVAEDKSRKKVYIATGIGRELVSLEINRMRNLILKGEKKFKEGGDHE